MVPSPFTSPEPIKGVGVTDGAGRPYERAISLYTCIFADFKKMKEPAIATAKKTINKTSVIMSCFTVLFVRWEH